MKKYLPKILEFTPLFVVVIILAVYSRYLVPFIISAILSYVINPAMVFLEKKIGRIFALLIILVAIIAGIFLTVFGIVPEMISDTTGFVTNFDGYIKYFEGISNYDIPYKAEIVQQINDQLQNIGEKIVGTSYSVLMGGLNAVLIMLTLPILIFFMLFDKEKILANVTKIIPVNHRKVIFEFLKKLDTRMRGFLKGQMTDFIVFASILFVGFTVLGVHYSFSLAILCALFNIIPYLGILIGATIMVMMSYFQYQTLFGVVKIMIFYGIVQGIESTIVSPMVIGKSASIHPLAIIMGITIGGATFGFTGIIFAIPALIFIDVVLEQFGYKAERK